MTNTQRSSTGKVFFIIGIISVIYFSWLMSSTKLDITYAQWVRVFVELLTIPMLLGQGILLLISFIQWKQGGYQKTGYLFWAMLIFFLTTLVCWGSLFSSAWWFCNSTFEGVRTTMKFIKMIWTDTEFNSGFVRNSFLSLCLWYNGQ